MAGLGRKIFTAGEVLTAANVQGFLQDQVVQVYDDATDRSTVLGANVTEGMVTYLKDVNTVQVYDGTNWVVVTSDPTITDQTAPYTIQESDANQYIRITDAGTVTIANTTNFDPAQQVAIFADGTSLTIQGDGNVTLSGDGLSGTGVTFESLDQFDLIGIICIGTDSYRVVGNVLGA